jgi:hypothetical protein
MSEPFYFPGEREAIATVKELGARHGYGNLIARLKDAWSEELQARGMDRQGADMAARHVCVWCLTDSRTGRKVTNKPRKNRASESVKRKATVTEFRRKDAR